MIYVRRAASIKSVRKVFVPACALTCSRVIFVLPSQIRELVTLGEPVVLSGVEMAQVRANPPAF